MMSRVLIAALGTASLVSCVPLDAHLDPKLGTAKDAGAPDLDIRDATLAPQDAGAAPGTPTDASASDLDANSGDAGTVASRSCQPDEPGCPSAACYFSETIGYCDATVRFYSPSASAADSGIFDTPPDVKSYTWQLVDKPDGSKASNAGTVSSSEELRHTFAPDVPGTYRYCVQASTDQFDSPPGCCELTIPTFAATFEPTRSSITLEDIELNGSEYVFAFSSNQRVVFEKAMVAVNGVQQTDWYSGGFFAAEFFALRGPLARLDGDALANLKDTLHLGDTLKLTARVKPNLSCHEIEITQEMTLVAEPEAPADAPVITDVVFADSASQQSLRHNVPIRVRFAAERPAGTRLAIGGWWAVATG